MAWTLYKVELFKMVKRPAARITVLVFVILVIYSSASTYYNNRAIENVYFGFPNAWDYIFGLIARPVSMFSSVIVILLIANEFDWKTSRQNIIDGVAKNQWFIAKVLLLPTIVLLIYIPLLSYDITLAWLATDPAIEHAFEIGLTQYLAFTGTLIGVLGYTSIALLFSMATRSAGAAMGITVVYPLVEELITKTLRGLDYERLADCFPARVISDLFNYSQYFPVGSRRRSWTVTEWDTSLLFAAGIGWILVFLILSWLVYNKRDL